MLLQRGIARRSPRRPHLSTGSAVGGGGALQLRATSLPAAGAAHPGSRVPLRRRPGAVRAEPGVHRGRVLPARGVRRRARPDRTEAGARRPAAGEHQEGQPRRGHVARHRGVRAPRSWPHQGHPEDSWRDPSAADEPQRPQLRQGDGRGVRVPSQPSLRPLYRQPQLPAGLLRHPLPRHQRLRRHQLHHRRLRDQEARGRADGCGGGAGRGVPGATLQAARRARAAVREHHGGGVHGPCVGAAQLAGALRRQGRGAHRALRARRREGHLHQRARRRQGLALLRPNARRAARHPLPHRRRARARWVLPGGRQREDRPVVSWQTAWC